MHHALLSLAQMYSMVTLQVSEGKLNTSPHPCNKYSGSEKRRCCCWTVLSETRGPPTETMQFQRTVPGVEMCRIISLPNHVLLCQTFAAVVVKHVPMSQNISWCLSESPLSAVYMCYIIFVFPVMRCQHACHKYSDFSNSNSLSIDVWTAFTIMTAYTVDLMRSFNDGTCLYMNLHRPDVIKQPWVFVLRIWPTRLFDRQLVSVLDMFITWFMAAFCIKCWQNN